MARFAEVVDPRRARERSFCCGAGGGQMFLGEKKGQRINVERAEELVATGAQTIGTACPFCQSMLRDALGRWRQRPEAAGHRADRGGGLAGGAAEKRIVTFPRAMV